MASHIATSPRLCAHPGSARVGAGPGRPACRRTKLLVVRSAAQPSDGAAASAGPGSTTATAEQLARPTVTLRLRKPVGVVFAQKPEGGPVYVEELVAGGAAAKTGKVEVGDVLVQCSAVILKAGREGEYQAEGYGQRPYDNWETRMFDCAGLDFKTVMAALKSNNERWGIRDVTLVLQRPQPQQ